MISWQTGLPAEQRRIIALIDATTETDGVAPVGDQVLRELGRDDTRTTRLRRRRRLTGYLNLGPGMAELVVHPAARGGAGSAPSWSRTGLAASGAVRIWAHGNLAPARARRTLGLTPNASCSRCAAGAAPAAAAGGQRRIAHLRRPAGDAELLRVNNAAFSGISLGRLDRVISPNAAPRELVRSGRTVPSLRRAHAARLPLDEGAQSGADRGVRGGVDPAAQGRGLKPPLTWWACTTHSAAAGPAGSDVTLCVEGDNTAAVKTYRRLGVPACLAGRGLRAMKSAQPLDTTGW